MKPIRQLAGNLTFLQPQRLSATPAARTLRGLARQARQAMRQYLPKRHPGTPASTEAQNNRFNSHDCLKDLQASHQRSMNANEEMWAHGLVSVNAMRADIVSQQQQVIEVGVGIPQGDVHQPADWESAYNDFYADKDPEAAPEIPQPVSEPVPAPAPEPATVKSQAVPVAHTEAELKALADAHTAITAAMGQARVKTLPDLRARDLATNLQKATEAIAAIPDREAGAADADSAHLEALKGYEASLKAAYRNGVVLRADILSRGGNDKALDPLMEKLAAQQKAVSAYIRLLEA